MTNFTPKLFANIIRSLLLLCSLLAGITVYLWCNHQAAIHRFDKSIKKHYVKGNEKKLQKALNSDQPIDNLYFLLEDLNIIKKQDTLYPLKMQVYEKLIAALRSHRRFDDALAICQHWLKIDKRNLLAQVLQAQLLILKSDTRLNGHQQLATLYARFPTSKLISKPYLYSMIEQQNYSQAINVLIDTYEQNPDINTNNWQLFWDNGKRYSGNRRISLKLTSQNNNHYIFNTTIDDTIKGLRVDPPGNNDMRIYETVIKIRQHQQELISINLVRPDIPRHQLQFDKSCHCLLSQNNNDPHYIHEFKTALKPGAYELTININAKPDYFGSIDMKKFESLFHSVEAKSYIDGLTMPYSLGQQYFIQQYLIQKKQDINHQKIQNNETF